MKYLSPRDKEFGKESELHFILFLLLQLLRFTTYVGSKVSFTLPKCKKQKNNYYFRKESSLKLDKIPTRPPHRINKRFYTCSKHVVLQHYKNKRALRIFSSFMKLYTERKIMNNLDRLFEDISEIIVRDMGEYAATTVSKNNLVKCSLEIALNIDFRKIILILEII